MGPGLRSGLCSLNKTLKLVRKRDTGLCEGGQDEETAWEVRDTKTGEEGIS